MTDKEIVWILARYLETFSVTLNTSDADAFYSSMQEYETKVVDIATDGILDNVKSVRRAHGLGT